MASICDAAQILEVIDTMKEVYVVNCCRTAMGSYGGSLKDTPAVDLGAIVIKEALKRANVPADKVDEVMFGCILTGGLGQNPARQAAVKAGIPSLFPLTPWVWSAAPA